jgi:hypothetical protein
MWSSLNVQKLLAPKNNAQIFPLHEKVYKFVSNSNVVEFNKTINIVFSNEMELNINVLVWQWNFGLWTKWM